MAEIVTALNAIEEVLEGLFILNWFFGAAFFVLFLLKNMKGGK